MPSPKEEHINMQNLLRERVNKGEFEIVKIDTWNQDELKITFYDHDYRNFELVSEVDGKDIAMEDTTYVIKYEEWI